MFFYSFLNLISFAYTITGQVVSELGTVPHSQVYLFDQRQVFVSTQADADGNFVFESVEPGWYRLLTIPVVSSNAVPRYYPSGRSYCDGDILKVDDDDEIQLDLPIGSQIMATVSLNGEPIDNVLVIAQPKTSSFTLPRGNWTDETGAVIISGIDTEQGISNEYYLSFEAEGSPDQWLGGAYFKEDSEVILLEHQTVQNLDEIELLEGIYVGGLVYSGSTPIVDANVNIYSSSQITSAVTDESGEYWVSGLPPGDALAWATADSYATTYSLDHDRPTNFVSIVEGQEYLDLNISMDAESSLTFLILDEETGLPILGSSVLVYNDNRTVGRGEPVDDDGYATVNGLYGGEYQVYVYAANDGYTSDFYRDESGEEQWISLASQEDKQVDIYLQSTFQLSGKVVDENNDTIHGATVLLRMGEETLRGSSNENGDYSIYGITDGDWTVDVYFQPLCPSDIGYLSTSSSEESLIVSSSLEQDFVLNLDHDQDAMPTYWEIEMGLDPYVDDSTEDPDNDGATNFEEYLAGTDPLDSKNAPKNNNCGCTGGAIILPFPLVLLSLFRRKDD
jgi:hypothetical protein